MTELSETAKALLSGTPLASALGLVTEAIEPGMVTMTLPYDARLIGDPATDVIHGGAISVLMDTAGGGSVMSYGGDIATTATLNLRIDYMRPATPGQPVRAVATCGHMTRNVAFVRIVATDGDPARPVAEGTGAFAVERLKAAE